MQEIISSFSLANYRREKIMPTEIAQTTTGMSISESKNHTSFLLSDDWKMKNADRAIAMIISTMTINNAGDTDIISFTLFL